MKKAIGLYACCLALALTACSSDNQSDAPASKDGTRLSATLPAQPAAKWSVGDEVRVLNLASISPNRYVAGSASSGATAEFTLVEGSADLVTGDETVNAYTPNTNLKGLWANKDNETILGQRIPHAYEADEVGVSGTLVPRPVALWSPITFTQDGLMRAELRSLTALLTIPSSSIPAACEALLIVTHNSFKLNGETVQGGQDEPLSGMFEAVLTGSPALAPAEDAVTGDTLRINLDPATNYDSYCIPIIAGTYSNLQVIALTGDKQYTTYDWTGTRLLQFKDKTFTTGVVY